MLTESGCVARREALWSQLPIEIDSVLITAPPHLAYFAGFESSPYVFNSQESQAALILTRKGDAILVCDNVQEPFAKTAFVTDRVHPLWYNCTRATRHRGELFVESAVTQFELRCGAVAGIEFASCPAGVIEKLKADKSDLRVFNLDGLIRTLRRKKLSDEISAIRNSLRGAEAGLAAVRKCLEPGMTGLDVYRLVLKVASETVAAPVRVYGDFVSGPECESGGGPASPRAVAAGDLVLLDYSVVLHGYRGDFCTTFVCQGQPSEKQRQMHRACMAAIDAGKSHLKSGVTGRAVYEATRAPLVDASFGNHFPHHAGHGVGLGHPEPPYFVPESDEVVVAGDVVTLEPGLYVPGVGGMRFEHNYLITDSGCEQLTHHSVSLIQHE